ncbi:hypothetical protein LENED_002557 [Lentinula edodes]|uniref:DUF6535 domain-containing protein n=1 Tax=Lentinula edodes TaxID=5353 RepID=A0A1Q3E1B6_LENED|nr:hypothetical protein LENED_002557 [Lentinula edodes]
MMSLLDQTIRSFFHSPWTKFDILALFSTLVSSFNFIEVFWSSLAVFNLNVIRLSKPDFNNDYEQKYPEVPVFEEMGPNARVWRMYLAESSMFDDNMVGEARDGLDAMLVFAGLFSAVVTTFVVQTSQSLQPEVDYTQVSASLLSELVFLLRAAASGSPLNSILTSSLPLNAMTPTHNILDIWLLLQYL